MIKIAIISLITVVVAVMSKSIKSEYGFFAGFAGCIILVYLGMDKLSGIVGIIDKLKSYLSGNSGYITLLIKMLGIAYVAELTSGICKDAGHAAIASQVEMIGKFSILLISTPILEALFDTVFLMIR